MVVGGREGWDEWIGFLGKSLAFLVVHCFYIEKVDEDRIKTMGGQGWYANIAKKLGDFNQSK